MQTRNRIYLHFFILFCKSAYNSASERNKTSIKEVSSGFKNTDAISLPKYESECNAMDTGSNTLTNSCNPIFHTEFDIINSLKDETDKKQKVNDSKDSSQVYTTDEKNEDCNMHETTTNLSQLDDIESYTPGKSIIANKEIIGNNVTSTMNLHERFQTDNKSNSDDVQNMVTETNQKISNDLCLQNDNLRAKMNGEDYELLITLVIVSIRKMAIHCEELAEYHRTKLSNDTKTNEDCLTNFHGTRAKVLITFANILYMYINALSAENPQQNNPLISTSISNLEEKSDNMGLEEYIKKLDAMLENSLDVIANSRLIYNTIKFKLNEEVLKKAKEQSIFQKQHWSEFNKHFIQRQSDIEFKKNLSWKTYHALMSFYKKMASCVSLDLQCQAVSICGVKYLGCIFSGINLDEDKIKQSWEMLQNKQRTSDLPSSSSSITCSNSGLNDSTLKDTVGNTDVTDVESLILDDSHCKHNGTKIFKLKMMQNGSNRSVRSYNQHPYNNLRNKQHLHSLRNQKNLDTLKGQKQLHTLLKKLIDLTNEEASNCRIASAALIISGNVSFEKKYKTRNIIYTIVNNFLEKNAKTLISVHFKKTQNPANILTTLDGIRNLNTGDTKSISADISIVDQKNNETIRQNETYGLDNFCLNRIKDIDLSDNDLNRTLKNDDMTDGYTWINLSFYTLEKLALILSEEIFIKVDNLATNFSEYQLSYWEKQESIDMVINEVKEILFSKITHAQTEARLLYNQLCEGSTNDLNMHLMKIECLESIHDDKKNLKNNIINDIGKLTELANNLTIKLIKGDTQSTPTHLYNKRKSKIRLK